MPDTLHLALTDEELKDLLRRGFAYSGRRVGASRFASRAFGGTGGWSKTSERIA
jgi:hypothetical protein